MRTELNKKQLIGIFLPFFLLFLVEGIKPVHASSSSPYIVYATVQLSTCGNNIREVSEECDINDVESSTCESLGHGGGKLTCDFSCSFDYSSCDIPEQIDPDSYSVLLTPLEECSSPQDILLQSPKTLIQAEKISPSIQTISPSYVYKIKHNIETNCISPHGQQPPNGSIYPSGYG